jgi:hypothetical protein
MKNMIVGGMKCAIGFVVVAVLAAMVSEIGTVVPPHVPEDSPTALIPPWFAFKIGCKLHEVFKFLAFATTPPDAYVIDLSTAYWNSEVTYALVYNKILDAVQAEGSPVSCETTASKLDLQAFVVCRYMESGKNINLLAKDPSTNKFSLTPHGSLLTASGGLRDFALMINGETRHAWRAAGTQLIKQGEGEFNSGFALHYKKDIWEFFNENPEQEAEFGRAMTSLSGVPAGALLSDWKPPAEDATVCDIGGGVGSMLASVMQHYPKMKGYVFDQPNVSGRANEYLNSVGLGDRASAIGGDFFKAFPEELSECDVYLMRFIVHDWPDKENIQILKNIKAAANSSSSGSNKYVVILDQIIETGAPSFLETAKSFMSINMISSVSYGARERSIPEHVELFEAAGYDKLDVYSGKTGSRFYALRSIHSAIQIEI